MIISTKGQYALRLMMDLATYYRGDPVKVKDIAKREDISDKYLEQIIASLNKAGLVKSLRGAKGGYTLSREPEAYTVGMILKVVEGPITATDSSDEEVGENFNLMVCRKVYDRLDKAIEETIEGVTLSDMLEWKHNMMLDVYNI